MPDTIKTGTILIKEGTLLPEVLRFESEPCALGWRLVKNLDGYGLGRKIREAGWTFSRRAGEIGATVFGLDEQKTLRRAVEQILAQEYFRRSLVKQADPSVPSPRQHAPNFSRLMRAAVSIG